MNITKLCANCNRNNYCTMLWETSNKKCPHFIPKTNADRIRAMSDEDLAKWMAECNAYGERADASQWLPWLKQPVEVEDGQA